MYIKKWQYQDYEVQNILEGSWKSWNWTLNYKCSQGFTGTLGKSECRNFKFIGIACIPAIPVVLKSQHYDFHIKIVGIITVQADVVPNSSWLFVDFNLDNLAKHNFNPPAVSEYIHSKLIRLFGDKKLDSDCTQYCKY